MRRFLSLLLLILGPPAMVLAQTSMTQEMQNAPARKAPLAEYVGTWIGSFEGHTWMTIRLELQGKQLFGTLQRPEEVQFNDRGDIKSTGEAQLTATVENAALQGDGLLLTVKDPNHPEPDRYLLRLTSANTAELRMVAMSMPPGMPKPKPFKLSRVGPSAVTPMQ